MPQNREAGTKKTAVSMSRAVIVFGEAKVARCGRAAERTGGGGSAEVPQSQVEF